MRKKKKYSKGSLAFAIIKNAEIPCNIKEIIYTAVKNDLKKGKING